MNVTQPKIKYSYYIGLDLKNLSANHIKYRNILTNDVFERTTSVDNAKKELDYNELINADIDEIKVILDEYKDDEGRYFGVEGLDEDSIEEFYENKCKSSSERLAIAVKLFNEKEKVVLGDEYADKDPADKFSVDNEGIWYTTDIIKFQDLVLKLDDPVKLKVNLRDYCLNLASVDKEVLLKLIDTYCKKVQKTCEDYPKSQEDKKELVEKIQTTLTSFENNKALNSKFLSRKIFTLMERTDSILDGNVKKLDKPEEFPEGIVLNSEPVYEVSYDGANTINYFDENGSWVISKQLDSNQNVVRYETSAIDSISSDGAGAKDVQQVFRSRYSFTAYDANGEIIAQKLNKPDEVVLYKNGEEKFSYKPTIDAFNFLKMYFEGSLSIGKESNKEARVHLTNIKTELFNLLNEESDNPISSYFDCNNPALSEFKDYLNSLDKDDKYYNLIKECIKKGGGKLILTFGKGKDDKYYFAINNVKLDLHNDRNRSSLISAIPNKNSYNGKCSETMLQYIAGDALVDQDFYCLKLTIDDETDEIDCKNFNPCTTCAQATALYGYNFKPLEP